MQVLGEEKQRLAGQLLQSQLSAAAVCDDGVITTCMYSDCNDTEQKLLPHTRDDEVTPTSG